MIRIYLPAEQREMLEKARRIRTTNLSERCLAVLLSDRGQSVPVIANSIGRHEHTIRSWLKAYLQDGIEGLRHTPHTPEAKRWPLPQHKWIQMVDSSSHAGLGRSCAFF
jgi:transposase